MHDWFWENPDHPIAMPIPEKQHVSRARRRQAMQFRQLLLLTHTTRRDRTPDLVAICMDFGQPNSLNLYGSGSDHGTCPQIK